MTAGLRRDLGTLESYATLLGILIGAGIFKVTGEAFLLTGPSVILGVWSRRVANRRTPGGIEDAEETKLS